MTPEQLLEIALNSAKKAGKDVMDFYQQGNFTAETKADQSPVTSADIAANNIIMAQLKTLSPNIPVISEEVGTVSLSQRKNWQKYWLIDPIDGTGEFILGSGDFAVNIALIENGQPSIGVVHAPDHGCTYYGQKNLGAFKETRQGSEKIQVAQYQPNRTITVAISRRQELALMGQYLNKKYSFDYVGVGSCSLKICLVAEGGADCYIRIGETGEWDTGASQCILEQAGGKVLDSEFNPITYNQQESLSNPDFISLGSEHFNWQDIIKAHRAIYS